MRNIFYKIHCSLGLLISPFILVFLMCSTITTLRNNIIDASYSDILYAKKPTDQHINLDSVVHSCESKLSHNIKSLQFYSDNTKNLLATYKNKKIEQIAIDPYSGDFYDYNEREDNFGLSLLNFCQRIQHPNASKVSYLIGYIYLIFLIVICCGILSFGSKKQNNSFAQKTHKYVGLIFFFFIFSLCFLETVKQFQWSGSNPNSIIQRPKNIKIGTNPTRKPINNFSWEEVRTSIINLHPDYRFIKIYDNGIITVNLKSAWHDLDTKTYSFDSESHTLNQLANIKQSDYYKISKGIIAIHQGRFNSWPLKVFLQLIYIAGCTLIVTGYIHYFKSKKKNSK